MHAFLAEVTPTQGKGALGTWRFQGGARTLSRDEADPRSGDELMSKPANGGVYAGQGLSQAVTGKAHQGNCQGQNRTGEIPLSGIVGGLAGTWTRWDPE